MVYGMVWRTSHGVCYGLAKYAMVCGKASMYIVYKGMTQVEGLLNVCFVHTYISCSLWAGIVDREIVNLYITVLGQISRHSQLLCAKRRPSFCDS